MKYKPCEYCGRTGSVRESIEISILFGAFTYLKEREINCPKCLGKREVLDDGEICAVEDLKNR